MDGRGEETEADKYFMRNNDKFKKEWRKSGDNDDECSTGEKKEVKETVWMFLFLKVKSLSLSWLSVFTGQNELFIK